MNKKAWSKIARFTKLSFFVLVILSITLVFSISSGADTKTSLNSTLGTLSKITASYLDTTGRDIINYKAQGNNFTITFKNNSNQAGAVTFIKDNYQFTYDLSGGQALWKATSTQPQASNTFGGGFSSNTKDTQIAFSKNNATYANAFSFTNVSYSIYGDSVKENFIISNISSGIKDYLYLEYSGNIKFNSSLKICANKVCYVPSGNQDDFTTSGQIDFQDDDDKIIYSLPAPVAIDSNGNKISLTYVVHGSNAQMNFYLRIPTSFLRTAIYPIHADPTIEIPPEQVTSVFYNFSQGSGTLTLRNLNLPENLNNFTITENVNNLKVSAKDNAVSNGDLSNYEWTYNSTLPLTNIGYAWFINGTEEYGGDIYGIINKKKLDFTYDCQRNFEPYIINNPIFGNITTYNKSSNCSFQYYKEGNNYILKATYLSDENIDPTIVLDQISSFTTSVLNNVTVETGKTNFSHLSVSDNNVLGYWTFDAEPTNTATTTFYDLSKNNSDGTGVGNANTSSACGYIGNGLCTDGAGDYVTTTQNVPYRIANPSVCAWIKTRGPGDQTTQMIVSKQGAGTYGWRLDFDATNNRLDFVTYKTSGTTIDTAFTPTSSIGNSIWYFVCGTYDTDTTPRIYLNGVIGTNGTSQGGITYDAEVLNFGRYPGGNYYFNGSLDNVMIFNRSLSATEIGYLYNQSSSKFYPTGTQYFLNLNLTNGSNLENQVNITLSNCLTLNLTNLSGTIGINNGAGYTYNGTIVNFTNCVANNVSIPGNPSNTSLRITQYSNQFNSYNPAVIGNITEASYGGSGGADTTPPTVSLDNPPNNTFTTNPINSFNASFSDATGLINATLYIWNSTGSVINTTLKSLSGFTNSSNITVVLPYQDNFKWNYYVCDNVTPPNCGFASSNYTLIYNPSKINLDVIYPTNLNNIMNVTQNQFFNITVNVSCINGNCGDINVSLDPTITETRNATNQSVVYSGACSGWDAPSFYSIWNYAGAYAYSGITEYNISGLPSVSSAQVCYNVAYEFAMGNPYNMWLLNESGKVCPSTSPLNPDTDPNLMNKSTISVTGGNWYCFDITNKFNTLISGGNTMMYISLWGNGTASNTAYVNWNGIGGTTQPYLNVTYTSGAGTKGLISSVVGTTPFYTNESNPRTINLNQSYQLVNFWVNATGAIGTNYTFFAFANETSNLSISNITNTWNVKIVNATIDIIPPEIIIVNPTAQTYITNNTYFNVSTNEPTSWCGLSLNGAANVSMTRINSTWYNYLQSNMADGAYTAVVYCNDTSGNFNKTQVNFAVDVIPPSITLTSPLSISYLNNPNITFNFTPQDSNGILNCSLYGNWSGSWSINQTNSSIINGVANYFFALIPDGVYKWNVLCYDGLNTGDFSAQGNQTFSIDTKYPQFITTVVNISNNSIYSAGNTYNINVTILNNNGTAIINLDGINHSMTNDSITNFNYIISSLLVGKHTYFFYAYGNGTSHNLNISSSYDYYVAPASSIPSLALNGVQNNITITYPTQINASGWCDYGTVTLYRNATDVTTENNLYVSLGAGVYVYETYCSGDSNHSTSTIDRYVTINKKTGVSNLTTNPPTPIVYGTNSNFSCSNPDGLTSTLYVNGTDKTTENNINTIRGAGTYNVSCITTGNANISSSINSTQYYINQLASTPYLKLNDVASDLVITYPTQVNASGYCDFGTPTLTRNSTNVGTENNVFKLLGVNYYLYNTQCSGDANHSVASLDRYVTINQATASLGITGTSPITYGTISDFVGTNCPSGASCNLNMSNQIYGTGTWTFNYSFSGNTNYTFNWTIKNLLVNKNTTDITLLINNSYTNQTIDNQTAFNVSCYSMNGLNVSLYKNGSLVGNNTFVTEINISNLVTLYNYTCIRDSNSNYSDSFKFLFLNISEFITIPPGGGGGGPGQINNVQPIEPPTPPAVGAVTSFYNKYFSIAFLKSQLVQLKYLIDWFGYKLYPSNLMMGIFFLVLIIVSIIIILYTANDIRKKNIKINTRDEWVKHEET